MIDQIVVVETSSLPEGFVHYLLSDKIWTSAATMFAPVGTLS